MLKIQWIAAVAGVALFYPAGTEAMESQPPALKGISGTSLALSLGSKPDRASFAIGASDVAEPAKEAKRSTPNIVRNSSEFQEAYSSFLMTTTTPSQPDGRPDRVHDNASSGPPACGPSTVSVEHIKALVSSAADKYGVDPDFALAVTWTESRFDRIRNSPKGARGAMQLMPGTAQRFGVEDVCDPFQNIDGGMRYLRRLLDEFKNPIIAAAAYNAGEQSIYDYGGIPAYPETIRYVASVINHQLGLGVPVRRADKGVSLTTGSKETVASDVLGAREPKFIGGVMQF